MRNWNPPKHRLTPPRPVPSGKPGLDRRSAQPDEPVRRRAAGRAGLSSEFEARTASSSSANGRSTGDRACEEDVTEAEASSRRRVPQAIRC